MTKGEGERMIWEAEREKEREEGRGETREEKLDDVRERNGTQMKTNT